MELTRRKKQLVEGKRFDQFDKSAYTIQTPCRWYVHLFQHIYYYTKDVEINEWRPNKNKPDKHIIYALFVCMRLINFEPRDDEKMENGDVYFLRWFAFDKETKFYKDWNDAYIWRPLGQNPPSQYDKFFNKELSEKNRIRAVDNSSFNDYYEQVNDEDFSNIIWKLLQIYQAYILDENSFRSDMSHNRAQQSMFTDQSNFVYDKILRIVTKIVGNSEDGAVILSDFSEYRLYTWWINFYTRFKDEFIDTLPRVKKDKKEPRFSWRKLRAKKGK